MQTSIWIIQNNHTVFHQPNGAIIWVFLIGNIAGDLLRPMGIISLELILCSSWVDAVHWDIQQFQREQVKIWVRLRAHLSGKKHLVLTRYPLGKSPLATRQLKPAESSEGEKQTISYSETLIKNCLQIFQILITHYLTWSTEWSQWSQTGYI